MNHRLLLFFFLFLPFWVQSQVTDRYEDNGFIFTVTVDTSSDADLDDPSRRYYRHRIRSIEISRRNQSEVVQVIESTSDEQINKFIPGELLFFDDINFDGIKDIHIVNQTGMYWGTELHWVYDREAKKYVSVPILSEVNWPEVYADKKLIHSYWRIGLAEFGHAIYGWEGKECVLLKQEKMYENFGGETILSQGTRKNGEMVDTSDQIDAEHFSHPYHTDTRECSLMK